MPAESINPICLIKHSLRKELKYIKVLHAMQNGHAERLGRTLMDKAESMWHQACIPDSWWEFAFHLRVFGCGAFVYLPATARANKMAPKSELMTYIGVAPGNERNFLFMRSTNAMFTTAHAVFDEHHFPCCPKNRCETLENPFGRVNPKPTTD